MASNTSESSFITQILEDFRTGGSKRRGSSLLSKLSFDNSKEECGTSKRKYADDTPNECPDKFLKLAVSPKTSRDSFNKNHTLVSPLGSPWENHHLRRQLVEANLKISDFENQISRLHALREEMELVFKKDRESLQKQLDNERSRTKEVDSHLQVLRKREMEVKEELKNCKSKSNKDKLSLEKDVLNLQKRNTELQENLHEVEQNLVNERVASLRRIKELQVDATEKQQLLTDVKARNTELEQRLREAVQAQIELEITKQELQVAQQKIKELQKEHDDHIEAAILVKSHQHKVLHYSELEKQLERLREENSKLKTAIPDKLLLEEMVQDLKSRLAVSEDQEKELAWAKGRLSHLQSVLEQWYAVARDHCEGCMSSSLPPDPNVIRKKINELQERVDVLTADLGEVKSQLSDTRQRKELLNLNLVSLKKQIDKYSNSGEEQNNRLRLLQKKLHLITMERDSYRSQLDTYERDLTFSCSSLANQQNQQIQQQQQRIQTMEKILDGYRKMLEKLEMESDRDKGLGGNLDVLEKMNQLECERDKLLQEKELLQRRKDELEIQLEYRAIKGDFNPITSKFLHFRMNPAAEAAAQYEDEVAQLRSKCSRLEERVKLLEEGNLQDITQKVEENVVSSSAQEVKDLQDAINAQEAKMQRLKEVFHASAKEFREVCYELFGYKIDRNENIYKLWSMYADSPDDNLMFKRASDGTMDMMETPFSATLGELIDINLHQHHSFPLFLGAITLDLFNRQTIAQTEIH